NWQTMFGTQCQPGPEALNCAIQFIEAQAYFLRTPLTSPARAPDLMKKLMSVR
ncbi:MAG: hypothetical protein HKM98_08550, partial [Gammaproteobacteria bacterium]|nr:hypothetical protein [Gammaproteobacteria bacterium]